MVVRGSWKPHREFLFVDNMAVACIFDGKRNWWEGGCSVGAGEGMTICKLAQTIMDVIGFQGQIVFDANKPDGTPRKLMDVARMTDLC